jgi:hypothetical protein
VLGADSLSRVALVSVGVLSATIAIAELRDSIELSSVSILADRLRNEQNIDFQTLQKITNTFEQDASLVSCRRDSLADALTVHLSYLDRLNETENYDEWVKGIERTSSFIQASIRCSPADGNLWLRMAMLRHAAVFLTAETADLMRRSVEFSPAQVNVLLARLEVWSKMGETELELASTSVSSDLYSLLAYGRFGDVAYGETRLSAKLGTLVRSQLVRLSSDRIKLLSVNGIRVAQQDLGQVLHRDAE